VGKTSVGFELFDQLSRVGIASAYVDLDQIGLCYPTPGDDPNHHRLKSRNLGEVWSGFRAAGARCLVISGLVDNVEEVRRHRDMLDGADLTVCRLRVGADELRARIATRGSLLHLTDAAVANAVELDRTAFADMVLDTANLAIAEVAARVRRSGWPGRLPLREASAPPRLSARPSDPVPVLWLCGPPAVGKSTVGFEVFTRTLADGVPAAYVDLAQIGFCRPAPDDDPDNHRLKAGHLGRIWPGFRAAGARCLIVSGSVSDQETVDRYQDELPAAAWTICRLRAGRRTLAERTLRRGQGGGPAIAGDALRGRPEAELHRRAAEAAELAELLDHTAFAHFQVDTDGRAVDELADLVRAGAGGWPG
jgi:hypothetical protein